MAMGSYSSDDGADDAMMSEINMTPLVDVMLVLLIIFIVTLPVLNHAVKLDLPQASSQPEDTKPAKVDLSIQADGSVFWDKQQIDDDTLKARLAQAADAQPQPELHLFADKNVRYESVAKVLSEAQTAGVTKLGFVTEPAK
ncbi:MULTISPECIES: biopolymer transporter ExbD [Pandoraea]|uniref:Biopolymer transporter ExbD n=1 Tax=Pandoraea capi TaxID=2508286 RepID=A0ABY6W455_9BURK|nr:MULTISPECIES: biopolymer transporter ExbD [Pandoraea]MCI3203828.1 biopolymer transporter ExbD [Pandoraea sp. LA3]MDN4581854.1 biopolymer transporter ExbD [Pandoraea capi]ODP34489.1 biopolymer transporter ExbD [Pandoraea sp. ISTKB]VVE23454.1 biopolymer transporter ExbD [Pandoraea capi]